MRKRIIYAQVMLGAGLLLSASCQKDEVPGVDQVKTQSVALGNDDEALEQRIIAFKNQCKFLLGTSSSKWETLVQEKEGCWLLEAALNHSYGFAGELVTRSVIDSCGFQIPIWKQDSVKMQDLARLWHDMTDTLHGWYDRVTWNDRAVLAVDLAYEGPPGTGSLNITMKAVIGKVSLLDQPFSNPFTDGDYWLYGGLAGKCGLFYGQGFGSDAAGELSQYQQWFLPTEWPGQGDHVYFTDIEHIMLNGNCYPDPDDDVPMDNMNDYLMFYNDPAFPNFHDCLNPDEMWHYLKGLYHVVSDADKARSLTTPPQKDFISLILIGAYSPSQVIQHRTDITYGIKHVSLDPALPVVPPEL